MKSKLGLWIPAAMLLTAAGAQAQGTAFTYQGRLQDGTNHATGFYDLTFGVWTTPAGPAQVGGSVTNLATGVTNGLFAVSLDFGSGVFDGSLRWLEIAVRTNGGGAFTKLSPRQMLTATPYAIHAGSVSGVSLSNLVAAYVRDATTNTVLKANFVHSIATNTLSASQLTSGTNTASVGFYSVAGRGDGLVAVPYAAIGSPGVTNVILHVSEAELNGDAIYANNGLGPVLAPSNLPSPITFNALRCRVWQGQPGATTTLKIFQRAELDLFNWYTTPGVYSNAVPTMPTSDRGIVIVPLASSVTLTNGQWTSFVFYGANSNASSISMPYWTTTGSAGSRLPFRLILDTNGAVYRSSGSYFQSGVELLNLTPGEPPLETLLSNLAATQVTQSNSALGGTVQAALNALDASVAGFSNYAPTAAFCLPATNYAVVGTEFSLYFDNVTRAPPDVTWDVTCPNGQQLEECFRLMAAEPQATNQPLSIVARWGSNTLASYAGTLRVASQAAGSGVSRKLLCVGDSTMAGGTVTTELERIASTNSFALTCVGSKGGGKHEAIAGWTFSAFYQNVASPFRNTNTGLCDFNFYLTNNSLTLASNDWVLFNLGINDVFGQSSDAGLQSVWAGTMQPALSNMVVNICQTVPGIRVVLCVTIPPSSGQDGFGHDYGSDQTYERYRRNRYLLAERLAAYAQTGVTLLPLHEAIDPVYGFQFSSSAVSSRATNMVVRFTNGVHPATSGYLQLADAIWAFLKGHEQ